MLTHTYIHGYWQSFSILGMQHMGMQLISGMAHGRDGRGHSTGRLNGARIAFASWDGVQDAIGLKRSWCGERLLILISPCFSQPITKTPLAGHIFEEVEHGRTIDSGSFAGIHFSFWAEAVKY